jgi:tetratricopeptide (TPR) repeat protein
MLREMISRARTAFGKRIDPLEPINFFIRHVPNSNPESFHVSRLCDDASATKASVVFSPTRVNVKGWPNSNLLKELEWYLERFLDYPFDPETIHAESVVEALNTWGEQAFQSLFGDHVANGVLKEVTEDKYGRVNLQIASDDPHVLSWPWEVIRDPRIGFLARWCQISRRLSTGRKAHPVPDTLSHQQLNILLVIARPYPNDVSYRVIARPLLEVIEESRFPVSVKVLRPHTFQQLEDHLHAKPGYYHVLHFDGHGHYGEQSQTNTTPESSLIFENHKGKPDPIAASHFAERLCPHAIPVVVLNACRSAMIATSADDPFSSVATALLKGGTQSVVAMAYSLFVSGARQFLPAFYGGLVKTGSVARAVKLGRERMFESPLREGTRGQFPLQDWFLPVLYELEGLDLSFVPSSASRSPNRASDSSPSSVSGGPESLFLGRDSYILALERALLREQPAILIHGLSGIGKTTLVQMFIQWLQSTQGLTEECFWFNCLEIRSAEYILTHLGQKLLQSDFIGENADDKIRLIGTELRRRKVFIVWENFEGTIDIPGSAVSATLRGSDHKLLGDLLNALKGSASKVIVTSRLRNDAFTPDQRQILELSGLDQRERWEFYNAIFRDVKPLQTPDDKHLQELMDFLDGHPLAMRVILPRLAKLSAEQVLTQLRAGTIGESKGAKVSGPELQAISVCIEHVIPRDLRPLLTLVAMHEGHILDIFFEVTAKHVGPEWTRDRSNTILRLLAEAGLLREGHAAVYGRPVYDIHPLVTTYLRSAYVKPLNKAASDHWARQFIQGMSLLATNLPRAKAPLPQLDARQQREISEINFANFSAAIKRAHRLGMVDDLEMLVPVAASVAISRRDFACAEDLYKILLDDAKKSANVSAEANSYRELAVIATERRDFESAKLWQLKHLAAIGQNQVDMLAERMVGSSNSKEKLVDFELASFYFQNGKLAHRSREFDRAETFYKKALGIDERLGNTQGLATTYQQLANLAMEQKKYDQAEEWCLKSVKVNKSLPEQSGLAANYFLLATIAQLCRTDMDKAEEFYRRSLAIEEGRHNAEGMQRVYHHLGLVEQQRGRMAAAKRWYYESLAIAEKRSDKAGAALSYLNLGHIVLEEQDYTGCEKWYSKAVETFKEVKDHHNEGLALTGLGLLEQKRSKFKTAAKYFLSAHMRFATLKDAERASTAMQLFQQSYSKASPTEQSQLQSILLELMRMIKKK